MLIEFSVSNYRSFRERQTLSMVAAPRLRRRENTFKADVVDEMLPDLLKVAVIYGPNASGKSSLLRALDVVGDIAVREPSAASGSLPVSPFRFDSALQNEPSKFEIHFVCDRRRYQFSLAATKERIVFERLMSFPKGKDTLLYERTHTDEGERYVFGPALEGGADLFETWRKITPPTLLFIAQAVANSNEELKQLRVPFAWLKSGTYSLLHGMSNMALASQRLAGQNAVHAGQIASFLREVDVPISKIKVEPVSAPTAALQLAPTGAAQAAVQKNRTTLTHQSALGEAELTFEDQSEGTKNLIGFWLPWVTKEPFASPRCILIVDELDSSLHPKIVAALVARHLKAEQPSQLIFTTHDTHLMDSKLLRRDQIWITERDVNGATQLRCIHDFEGRESEDIEKRYYEGRYRGLPLVKQD